MTTPLIRQVYRLRSQNNLSKADHFVVIPSYVESQFVYIYSTCCLDTSSK